SPTGPPVFSRIHRLDIQSNFHIIELVPTSQHGGPRVIVCQCHGVSDRTIRACIREGAETVKELGQKCAAGTGCGGCRPTLRSLLGALGGTKQLARFAGCDESGATPAAAEAATAA